MGKRKRNDPDAVIEVRPGVVRKTFEMPTELFVAMKAAAQLRGFRTVVLWRAAAIQWLSERTTLPPDAKPGSTAFALAAAQSASGNDKVKAVLGNRDPEIAKIFGYAGGKTEA